MGALGDDHAAFDQHHPVGQGDGGQPVGDQQGGAALEQVSSAAWMRSSTVTSMALVASSSTRMGGLASSVRAMAMRWRCPPDSV
jgi:hypothetical protein